MSSEPGTGEQPSSVTDNQVEIPQRKTDADLGKRKLDDLLKAKKITVREYLDPYSVWNRNSYIDRIEGLGDFDNDVLTYLLSEYFKPYSREGRPGLPPISNGFVSLFRGEHPRNTEKDIISPEGQGRWWTQFLDVAANYAEGDGGRVHFLDVPEDVAQKSIVSRTYEDLDRPVGGNYAYIVEFYIPAEYVDGEKGTQNVLDPAVVEDLLRQGEFTQYGAHPRTEYSDYTEQQKELSVIRSRLLDLAAEAISGFWLYYDYKNDPNFLKKHPDFKDDPPKKPDWPDNIETAEYLLAKISGWR